MTNKQTNLLGFLIGGIVLISAVLVATFFPSREPAINFIGSNLVIPYRIIDHTDNPPFKCSYLVQVDFVDGRLPTEAELTAVSNEIRSQGPKTDNTFVKFFMPGEDDSIAWATAHHTPELSVEFVRQPDPPSVSEKEKFGLSLGQRKRYFLEIVQAERASALPAGTTRADLHDPNKQHFFEAAAEREANAKAELLQQYGLTEEQGSEISWEGYNNAWQIPSAEGNALDAAILNLPAPPR